jgi:hypothetical protein
VVVDKSTNQPPSKIAAVIQHQHHNHELPITKSPTVIAAAKRVRDQPQPPNKLSERIVKCLVCIFMRLLRSSRVSEMDKSGNLAAKGGSFRMDTGLVNAAAAAKEKERGQQDHYGIFGVQDAIVRDIGPYKNLVRFTTSSLDLLRGFSASPLLTKLREMLEALQQVDVRSLNHQQRLAFWLNIYNTCIMHVRLSHLSPSSIHLHCRWSVYLYAFVQFQSENFFFSFFLYPFGLIINGDELGNYHIYDAGDSAAWFALKLGQVTRTQEQGAYGLHLHCVVLVFISD